MKRQKKLLLALVSLLTLAASSSSTRAQSFLVDIEVGLDQAGTMPVYEVVLGDDADALEVYRFVRACERRAFFSTGSGWARTRFSLEDVLDCRFHDPSSTLEVEISTVTGLEVDGKKRPLSQAHESLVARFQARDATEHRVRIGYEGDWSPWSTVPILRALSFPGEGHEESVHFDLEMRQGPASAAVAMSGYVKIKKLNSGE